MPARGSRALEAEVADCRNVSLEQLKGRADGLGQRSGGRTRSGESGDVMRNPMRRMLRAPVEFRSRRGVPRHGCATPSPAGKPQRWALADRATHRDVQPSHPTPSTITPPSRRLGPFVSAFASPLCGSTPSGPRPLLSYLSILQTRIRQTRIRTSISDNDKAGANH